MRRHFFLTAAMLFMAFVATAQTVSVADALNKAKALRTVPRVKKANMAQSTVSEELKLAYTSQSNAKPLYYVFNYSDGGFAIIGGDERARTVLGYCDEGTFDIDSIPADMRWMLSQYSSQIDAAIKADATVAAKTLQAGTQDVGVLMTTKWGQGSSSNTTYNYSLPDQTWLTGCVATATAQVMKYHNYPEKGQGSSLTYTNSGTTCTADFANTTYDWSNMPNSLASSSSTTKKQAVSTLMYHVGVAVHMSYSSTGSGAYTCIVAHALRSNFGYDNAIEYIERAAFGDSVWEAKMYNELANSRPIIYGGQDTNGNGGHCFVLDGYRASDNTFHVNWGWEGYCDGYFSLTGTNALGSASGYYFANDQDAVIGVQPPVTGSEPTEAFLAKKGYTYSPSSAEYGNSLTVSCSATSVSNLGYDYKYATVGVMLVNKDTQESFAQDSKVLYVNTMTWGSSSYFSASCSVSATFTNLPAGIYSVQPAYKLSECTQWHSMGELDDATLKVWLQGDANSDYAVDVKDVDAVANCVKTNSTTGIDTQAVDFDGDGNIDVVDVAKTINKALGK